MSHPTNIEQICLRTGYTYAQLLKRNREQPLPFARYLVMEKLSETIPENYVAKMFGLDRSMYYHAMLGVAKVRETRTPKTYFDLMLKFEGYDLSKIKESTINDLEAHLSPEKFEMVMDMLNSNLTFKID